MVKMLTFNAEPGLFMNVLFGHVLLFFACGLITLYIVVVGGPFLHRLSAHFRATRGFLIFRLDAIRSNEGVPSATPDSSPETPSPTPPDLVPVMPIPFRISDYAGPLLGVLCVGAIIGLLIFFRQEISNISLEFGSLPSISDPNVSLFVSNVDLWTMYGQSISLVTTWFPDLMPQAGDFFCALRATHETKTVSPLTLVVFSNLFVELCDLFSQLVVSASVQESLTLEHDLVHQVQSLERLCRIIFNDCEIINPGLDRGCINKILNCDRVVDATTVFAADIESEAVNAYLANVHKFLIKVLDDVVTWKK